MIVSSPTFNANRFSAAYPGRFLFRHPSAAKISSTFLLRHCHRTAFIPASKHLLTRGMHVHQCPPSPQISSEQYCNNCIFRAEYTPASPRYYAARVLPAISGHDTMCLGAPIVEYDASRPCAIRSSQFARDDTPMSLNNNCKSAPPR